MKKFAAILGAYFAVMAVLAYIVLVPDNAVARNYDELWMRVKNRLTIGTTEYNGRLSVGTRSASDVGIVSKGVTSQTGNLYEGRDVNDSILFKVDPAGDITAVTTTVNGPLFPKGVAADPCTGGDYGPGAFFIKTATKELCYCDESTDDLLVVDNSACF